jgi:hypothetical protein
MWIVLLLLAFTSAAPLAASPPECKPQFAPLETGSSSSASALKFWRQNEAGDWGGTGWLGWSRDSERFQPVRLLVRNLPKESADPEQAEVTVESIPKVTFAVRCVAGLRAGRIVNAGVTNYDLQYQGALEVTLGELRYRLYLEAQDPHLTDAKVILAHNSRIQVLYSADGFVDEPHFDIVWAGDLDRDGKLDLVVNLNCKYSWHPYRLLLSTKARGRDLVGEAAVFETGD